MSDKIQELIEQENQYIMNLIGLIMKYANIKEIRIPMHELKILEYQNIEYEIDVVTREFIVQRLEGGVDNEWRRNVKNT